MQINVKSEKRNSSFYGSNMIVKKEYETYLNIENRLVKNTSNIRMHNEGTIYLFEKNIADSKIWFCYLLLFLIFFWPLCILSILTIFLPTTFSRIDYFRQLIFLRFNIHNDKVEVVKIKYKNINDKNINIYIDDNNYIVRGVETYKVSVGPKKIKYFLLKIILFYICVVSIWLDFISSIIALICFFVLINK